MSIVFPEDEAFHTNSRMEWWYIACLVKTPNLERFALVSSFFSYSERRGDKLGHMLSYALMQLPNKIIATGSLIDKQLRDMSFTNLRHSVERGRANEYAKAYFESLKLCDVPRPHKVVGDSSFGAGGLDVRFGSNQLEKNESGTYHLGIEDERFSLELNAVPSKPVTLNGDSGIIDFDLFKMKSYSYTRTAMSGKLEIEGRVEPVSGEGWVDHVWGDWLRFRETLFKDARRSRRISWQWFGLQLDNNMEVNAWILKGAISGSKPMITITPQTGEPTNLRSIELHSRGSWQSLRTLNIYPLDWTVEVPEISLSVEMKPLVQAEMPLFGPVAGVLENLSSVHGLFEGREVKGICWAETVGDNFNYGNFWKGQKECVNSELEQIIPREVSNKWLTRVAGAPRWERSLDVYYEAFVKPVWDLMDRGGKRWRPIWMSMCCEAVGGDAEKFRDLMPIPELMHTGSLIVDDIEDESSERRGDDSLHLRYGIPIALNAANTLYYLPLLLIEENKTLSLDQKYRLYKLVAEAGRRAHLGQAADIFMGSKHVELDMFLKDHSYAKRLMLQICADKTGVQARTLGEMGAVVGRGSDLQTKALGDYSEVVGMTFQMINDISNLENSQDGKWGEDIAQGKLGLITLEAISNAKPNESEKLIQILKQRNPDRRLIQEAIAIIKRSGSLDSIKLLAENLMDEKWKDLSHHLDESDAKAMLKAGPKWLLHGEVESQL